MCNWLKKFISGKCACSCGCHCNNQNEDKNVSPAEDSKLNNGKNNNEQS